MTRIIKAELVRLARPRTMLVGAAVALVFSAVTALATFASAKDVIRPGDRGATLATLAGHGGGTEAFAIGSTFGGFLVFVTFIALMASEFSGGTFRSLLLRDPHRRRVIIGKLVGTLLVAAGIIALAEVGTFAFSLLMAPTKDIDTGTWFSLAGLGDALRNYGTVMAGVTGWAIFGTTLALVFRSAPIALAVGFAWAGPFENIVSGSWDLGNRIFPGRVLASVIEGGTLELGFGRAVLTAVIYTGVAAAVALTLVSRRDVTA
jgi:hypothetical protein